MGILNRIKRAIKAFVKKDTPNIGSALIKQPLKFETEYLTNPNLFVTHYGVAIRNLQSYYKIVREDEEISACIDQLKYKVTSLDDSKELKPCQISGGLKRIQKQVDTYANRFFKKLNIDKLKNKALNNLLTGISYFQLIWANKGKVDVDTGYVELEKIVERNPDYFKFKYNPDGVPELYYSSPYGGKEAKLSEYEFRAFQNGNSDLNPYGVSAINQVGAAWWFIRKGINKYRYRTMERKGDPALAIYRDKTENTPDEAQIRAVIDDMYKTMGIGGVTYFPQGLRAEYLETNMKNAFDYKQVWDDSINAIRVHILNATSTMSNIGNKGSYNQSSIHQNSEHAKIDHIAKNLEDFINQLIKTAIDINFRDVNIIEYPKYDITLQREQEKADKAEREMELNKKLVFNLIDRSPGKVPMKAVFDMFGIPGEHLTEDDYFGATQKQEDTDEQNTAITQTYREVSSF